MLPKAEQPQEILLVLCDISGYTRFVAGHKEALFHACAIIGELLRAVLKQVRAPLQVLKLEGDAVFLYAVAPQGKPTLGNQVLPVLDRAFAAFSEKRRELGESNICPCEACRNLECLRLKMVVHSGAALLQRIGRHQELSGLAVILVHRLLKNSVPQDEYLLLTGPARTRLALLEAPPQAETDEAYAELGAVHAYVYLPPLPTVLRPLEPSRGYASFYLKLKNVLVRIARSRLLQLVGRRGPTYRHLPEW